MEYAYSFDLTVPELQETMAPPAKGLFAGFKRKIMDKSVLSMFTHLAGPTTIELSAEGLRVTNSDGTRDIPWSQVRLVNERRLSWAVQLAPNGVVLLPAAAVPPTERAALAQHLRAWGPGYTVREGGMAGVAA
ncbi:YcxB family protein [Kitasatospora sp. NPDC002227]|uniref:YcxB family protein n=1 Tax=Kitasatospora sp. NPDC002227 TaxID=3154773 RepID=UPI003328C814